MMAERFGGKYSPRPEGADADPGGVTRRRDGDRRVRRLTALHLVALLFAISAFQGPSSALAFDLAALALLQLAAWLTRQGLVAEAAFNERKVARRPAMPRKLFAAGLTGVALFLGGYLPGAGLLNPIAFAAAGVALHLLAFGFDPMRDKGMEGIDTFQQDRVARVVDEAEKHLGVITSVAERLGDRALEGRVARFVAAARTMCRTVEEDPRDLTSARKYLLVYLTGARDATVKFADLWARNRDAAARADYEALLDDLETNFAARTRLLLEDNRSDLDVEIGVLRDRLKRDGIVAATTPDNGEAP